MTSEIGTADDIESVTNVVINVYLETERFVTVSLQKITKGKDRTDLVVYD